MHMVETQPDQGRFHFNSPERVDYPSGKHHSEWVAQPLPEEIRRPARSDSHPFRAVGVTFVQLNRPRGQLVLKSSPIADPVLCPALRVRSARLNPRLRHLEIKHRADGLASAISQCDLLPSGQARSAPLRLQGG